MGKGQGGKGEVRGSLSVQSPPTSQQGSKTAPAGKGRQAAKCGGKGGRGSGRLGARGSQYHQQQQQTPPMAGKGKARQVGAGGKAHNTRRGEVRGRQAGARGGGKGRRQVQITRHTTAGKGARVGVGSQTNNNTTTTTITINNMYRFIHHCNNTKLSAVTA